MAVFSFPRKELPVPPELKILRAPDVVATSGEETKFLTLSRIEHRIVQPVVIKYTKIYFPQ
jgi:hypothetical protein